MNSRMRVAMGAGSLSAFAIANLSSKAPVEVAGGRGKPRGREPKTQQRLSEQT